MDILKSDIDRSVNFVEQQLTGFIESRYVRKVDDYFIAYISSQTGCNRGCKFCHLTATGQTQFENCSLDDMWDQARTVFKHYFKDRPAKYVNFNFMARGEPLANPNVTDKSARLLGRLGEMADDQGLFPRFNISTIMPVTMKKPLAEMFPIITPTIYYSLYSVDGDFRSKWMPAAMPAVDSLAMLVEYQQLSKKKVKIHGAFIEGENDSIGSVVDMMQEIADAGLDAEFNVVRYNSFSDAQGRESPRLQDIVRQIAAWMPVKVIPRVGKDVSAACGMFVS